MPPSRLDPTDESAVVAYLRTRIPPGSEDRLVQSRARLEAVRVDALPADPDAPAWNSARPIRVALAPLAWHADAVLAAELAALHDSREIVVRVTWDDASGELRAFPDATASDAVALQISDAREPALFGMGSAHDPATVWHWRAVRVEDRAGVLDLLDPPDETRAPGRADVSPRRILLSRLEPSDRADRIVVRGVDTAAGAERAAAALEADARWQDGRWTVVFRRALRPGARGEVALAPGSSVQLSAAVWNGAAGDAGARKSISIWQELALAR